MEFRNLFKSIGDRVRAKNYLGILPGALPISNKRWGGSEYLSALEVSLYVNRGINKRSDKVSEITFHLKDKDNNEIDTDPVLDLLKKPNKVFTGPQFWKLVQTYYDAVGEVYILKESRRDIFEPRQLVGLHLLVPTLVTPKFGPDGMPSVFEYRTTSSEKTIKTIEYKPEQIIYLHNPDPKRPLRGQSLLQAGINAITTETQISQYHARILENGGKVEGVFKFATGPLTENQLEGIKDKYQKEYGAAKKAGLPMFLGGDADYINTGLTPAEMAFLDAKKMALEDICILTGVPKSILASTNEVKFDNADADRAIFLRETIKPLLQNLCAALDYELFPDDRTLTFVDPTPENVEEKRKVLETANAVNALTTNEKRRELAKLGIEHLDAVEGGDDILVPFSLAPLGAEPESDPAGDEEKALVRSKLVKGIEHPLRDPDVRTLYWKMQVKRMDKREKNFERAVNGYFDEQAQRIVELLEPTKTRYFRKKNLMDELFQIELEVKLGKKLFVPMLTDLLEEAGVDAAEFVGSEGAFNLTADIASWIENRADVFLRKINETTFKKLQEVFAESLAAEEGREALIRRIQKTYGKIQKSRAGMIARTEVHNATQYGTLQGYKQAGMPIKIWVSVRDSYTRDSHAAVDGEERPIDRPFSNGLMFPGDPKGPAEEIINCRCVI